MGKSHEYLLNTITYLLAYIMQYYASY